MSRRTRDRGPVTRARISALLAVAWIAVGVAIAAADPDLPELSVAKTVVDSTILVAMGAIIVGFVFLTWAFDGTDRV